MRRTDTPVQNSSVKAEHKQRNQGKRPTVKKPHRTRWAISQEGAVAIVAAVMEAPGAFLPAFDKFISWMGNQIFPAFLDENDRVWQDPDGLVLNLFLVFDSVASLRGTIHALWEVRASGCFMYIVGGLLQC